MNNMHILMSNFDDYQNCVRPGSEKDDKNVGMGAACAVDCCRYNPGLFCVYGLCTMSRGGTPVSPLSHLQSSPDTLYLCFFRLIQALPVCERK